MNFNGDISLATLQPTPMFPELYNELWWYSGSASGTSGYTSAGSAFTQKGSSGILTTASSSQVHLFTLSSSWPATQKCAFEAFLYQSTSGYTAYAALWDVTSGSIVSGSQITSTAGSQSAGTVTRSGQFVLTPSHTYAITTWDSNSSPSFYITDASLIIFPSAPLTSPSVSAISLANPSGNTLKEAPIPLWVYSSGTVSSSQTSSGKNFVAKGTTTPVANTSVSSTILYSLNSNWSASQKFALEASLYAGASSVTAYCQLWDVTLGVVVSSGQVSTTATTATLVRSGSFTLTPSHTYALTIWASTSSGVYLTKANLVALAQ